MLNLKLLLKLDKQWRKPALLCFVSILFLNFLETTLVLYATVKTENQEPFSSEGGFQLIGSEATFNQYIGLTGLVINIVLLFLPLEMAWQGFYSDFGSLRFLSYLLVLFETDEDFYSFCRQSTIDLYGLLCLVLADAGALLVLARKFGQTLCLDASFSAIVLGSLLCGFLLKMHTLISALGNKA